jgi:hypothetical protein
MMFKQWLLDTTIDHVCYNDIFNEHENDVRMMVTLMILLVCQSNICTQHQNDVKIIVSKIT